VGSDEDNLTLSDTRAEAVALILSDRFLVPRENLTTQGYGERTTHLDQLVMFLVDAAQKRRAHSDGRVASLQLCR
jgi:outer membrane protein OmpA-like peptidoglycan-associated protein